MKPKIGMSTKAITPFGWLHHLKDLPFRVIEIYRPVTPLYFQPDFLDKVARYSKGFDCSIHSSCHIMFSNDQLLTDAELMNLKGEIRIAQIIGAKEIVFHMSQDVLGKKEWVDELHRLLDFAKKSRVKLCWENDSKLIAKKAYDILDEFPLLGFNLDIGHLNLAIYNKACENWQEFVQNIQKRIVYSHVHNNHGGSDEHLALDNGTFEWQKALGMLKNVKKIICENDTMEDAVRSRELLEGFFK